MSERVREAVSHYHDLVTGRHADSTRDAIAACKGRILRPHFVEESAFAEIIEAATLLKRGLVVAADRLAKDPALRRKLDLPSYLERLIAIDRDNGLPTMVGRFDALVDNTGLLKVIEFNSATGNDPTMPDTFPTLPIAAEFRERYPFRRTFITDRILDLFKVSDGSTGHRKGVVGFPLPKPATPGDKYGDMTWPERSPDRGGRSIVATLDRFRHEGGRLWVEQDDGRVAVDFVVIHYDDLLEWATGPGVNPNSNPVFQAIRAGSARALSGVSRGILAGYKHTFELLSNPDYASIFEPDVLAAAARHVPWTRALRHTKTTYKDQVVDLLPFVAESRERWVLKPSGGSRGVGLVLGWKCTDDEWRQSLKKALPQKFIIQERVTGADEPFPFIASDGKGIVIENTTPTCEPFLWNGTTAEDAIVRLSSIGDHTIGGGGAETALWILEGAR